jgi:hypothetical protein
MSLRNSLSSLLLISLAALPGCGDGAAPASPGGPSTAEGPGPDELSGEDGVFESANPASENGSRGALGGPGNATSAGEGADNAGGVPPAAAPQDPSASDGDASRAIAEADIVQIEGDTLYALSQYGGLSAIDIGTQDQLTMLGRKKIVATPFEMYVQQGIVFALYQGYGEYVQNDDETWSWAQTSHVIVLDARDPAHITQLSKFAVPGYIADSRIVGDVLYVASFEDGYCWGCTENAPKTTVISLNVANPAQVSKVDQITFDEQPNYSWHRSIAVTDQRMYVAGPEWGQNGPIGSTIQVIDISDPSGDMVEGAMVQVAGQINNRWQMDEYEGVFRVLSQAPEWNLTSPPHVQTFTVVSSNELTPLGDTTLSLPRPEQLQSVRFDGTRAYAITFQQTDPLFTIDLSDPATPVQAGELVMPGWVYHMEPRGDRVVGLGYDNSSGTGSLHVSLFDVSDLSAPTMLARVNFGGEWGWFAEDQDRIHKAFKVLDDAGLVLMPFSGWSYTDLDVNGCGYGEWQSGIQLIDWANDTLTLRGIAPTLGSARRGFLHNERLFAMSDDRVETFDISDRDAPATTAKTALAQNVTQLLPVGDRALRIGQNWWTNLTQVDVTDLANVDTPLVDQALEVTHDPNRCYGGEYLQGALSDDERGYLIYQKYDYDPITSKETQSTRVVTVDASGEIPTVLGETVLAEGANNAYYYSYYTPYGLVDHGVPMLNVDSTLVTAHTEYTYPDPNNSPIPEVTVSELRVMDLSDPNQASVATVDLPTGLGSTGLMKSGSIVARSHYEASTKTAGAVRFFLDRVDVSDPAQPEVLPSINIPGSLLAFDAASSRALTVDYRSMVRTTTSQECYETANSYFYAPNDPNFNWQTGTASCVQVLYSINLVSFANGIATRLGHQALDAGEAVGQLAVGDDRAFLTLTGNYSYGFYGPAIAVDCAGPCGGYYSSFQETELPVLTVGGLSGGQFAVGRVNVPSGDYWGYAPIVAQGARAALSSGWRGSLSVIDASDASAPSVVRNVEVGGYVNQLTLIGNTAVAAMGYDGVQTISLGD